MPDLGRLASRSFVLFLQRPMADPVARSHTAQALDDGDDDDVHLGLTAIMISVAFLVKAQSRVRGRPVAVK